VATGLSPSVPTGSVSFMKTRIIQTEPTPSTPAAPRRTNFVARHRLVSFFVLAFVLAWWSWPLYQADIWPRQAFNAIGALLAAVIVIAVADGRAGFADLGRRMIRWRVPWYYYAFALLLPVVLRYVTSMLNSEAANPDWLHLSWSSFALWFLFRLVNPLDGPMAEEPSFRGHAVPHLQERRSPLASAAILGTLVSAWHLPLAAEIGWIGFASTFVITFVYVWLFNRTGGSVLLVLLFHNAQGFITFRDLGYTGAGLARQELIEFFAWLLVAVVLLCDRKAWRR
jgi:membrane protease YdiL (CAAX protease family)